MQYSYVQMRPCLSTIHELITVHRRIPTLARMSDGNEITVADLRGILAHELAEVKQELPPAGGEGGAGGDAELSACENAGLGVPLGDERLPLLARNVNTAAHWYLVGDSWVAGVHICPYGKYKSFNEVHRIIELWF